MADPRLVKLAKVLVSYSADVKPGNLVRISGKAPGFDSFRLNLNRKLCIFHVQIGQFAVNRFFKMIASLPPQFVEC